MKKVNSKTIHPSIRKLLSFATSDIKIDQEYEIYLNSLNRKLFRYESKGEIVGCIGIEIMSLNRCEIKHIAVSPFKRGKGNGSKMVKIFLINIH
ncbi:GNAT family N-acetyltransferase [Metabacillus sediminilitoris]|uniref:GNAT family N-acetyltransferase n=1 Tax=Metabacillus sediminilitoris TaxID=2567941 RepID=UPI001D0D8A24|nr:GNAT family N-acetyltransferase [Metabacillus sediminilitoris]